ncbi:MAG TPA: TonB-dependent receptor [Thermoanaerobaculia bacterium]|jgi:hypothetical protein|nr:TonB-dependent receptor [Thermoanaerobaculia bacterium]
MKQSRWLALVLLLALPALAFGQAQTTGRITGRVVDDQGNPVPNATVTATNEETQITRTTTSSASGDFLFALLPTGGYTVTIEATGKQPQVYRLSLGIGQTAPVNATLLPGDVITEEITVTGDQTALETTTVGESFDYEQQVEQLPITSREIEDVAQYSPNISYGPTGGTLAISGAPSFDTTVLLDGAEISDPYFGSAPVVYLEDAIDEVQVLTSGVSARYGRFQGGIINAVTKSGSNEFEGTLRTEFDNQKWNSQTPFEEEQTDNLNKTYQATLGGYIVKDRLWFFLGGRTIPTSSETFTAGFTNEPFTSTTEEDRYQAKIRGAITENHLVDISYLNFDQTTTNDDGLAAGEARALDTRSDPRETWTLQYQGVLTSNTFLELQATQKNVDIALGGDPSRGDPFLDLNEFFNYNNGWWDFNDPSERNSETANINVTHSLTTERVGTHTLEGGVQYVNSITGGENRQSSTGYNLLAFNSFGDFAVEQPDGTLRYNLHSQDAVRWVALPLGGDQEVKNTAVFLQDTINLNKLRLDLGVRYEQYDGSGPLPESDMSFDDIAPRLGATYNINQNWQVQGSYGKYISRFNDNYASQITSVGGAPRIETFYLGPDLLGVTAAELSAALRNEAYWPIVTGYISPAFPTSFLADDISAPYANELNFSVRHALPRNSGSLVLAYVNRDYKDLIDDFVGGVCDEFGFNFGEACPAGNFTEVPGDIVVDTTVWANNPNAHREYNAFNLVFDYRPNTKWQLGGNYTYSTLKGNYEGENSNQPASGSPLGNYERSENIGAATPDGYLSGDIRNRAVLYGNYRLDFQRAGTLSLGSLFLYQSGFPYSLTASVPRADIPEYLNEAGNYTYYFGGRNTRRFDDFWRLDVSARYEVPIYSRLNLFLKAAVTNVLDNDAVVKFATTGRAVTGADGQLTWVPVGNCGLGSEPSTSCTGFGRIRNQNDYQSPRRYLLTVGLDF